MPNRDIRQRLASGDVLLLDGATGTELDRRGVDITKGASAGRHGAWSATANVEAPAVVRQIHEDYLHLGVDIITSNNYWTCPGQLELIGQEARWEQYARAAGEIALAARDATNTDAYVAGGVALPSRGRGEPFREAADLAQLLATVGVDFMLAESIEDIAEAVLMADAFMPADLPIFLGIREVQSNGTLPSGESFEALVEALGDRPVDAILLMCSDPSNISASLPALRSAWPGPIGAYANIGYGRNPDFGTGPEATQYYRYVPSEDGTSELSAVQPKRYAEFAAEWVDLGAQIVGGCCAAGPEHIEAVARRIRGATSP